MNFAFDWKFCLWFMALTLSCTDTAPSLRRRKQRLSSSNADMTETMDYLGKYGYLNSNTEIGRPITSAGDPRFTKSLRRMQEYFHLPATGKLDRKTMRMLRKPRCGCPDIAESDTAVFGKLLPEEFKLSGPRYRWERTDLTYQYQNYSSGHGRSTLRIDTIREIVQRAFQLWSDVTPLNFREANDSTKMADIQIRFGRRHHHPEEPSRLSFDGGAGVLAHAFTPNSFWGDLEGDIHFDDDENFTVDGEGGPALLLVAAHEIGHSLGLAHSDNRNSLMWPNYNDVSVAGYRLPRDDIRGIRAIYGGRDSEVVVDSLREEEETTRQRNPDSLSSVCQDPVTALLLMGDHLHAFKGSKVWRIHTEDNQLVSDPSGEPANRYWKGIPRGLSAAYQRQDGNVVFFRGTKYYVYNGTSRVDHPFRIGTMGRPPRAAVRAHQLGPHKVYLIRGDQVWLYNDDTGTVDAGYPRGVSDVWSGLPSGITAGEMLSNGSAIFIKGDRYFEVNGDYQVTNSRATRFFSQDFIGCPP